METDKQDRQEQAQEPQLPRPTLLHRIWGALPTLFFLAMICIISVLVDQIKSEGEIIKAKKTQGLRQSKPKTNVVVMDMVPGLVRDRIDLPGVVRPWVSLTVVAEVRGKIVEKRVTEGQTVGKGDVLAVIDARDYQNAHASARASWEVAVAASNRLQALFADQLATQSQLDDAVGRVKTTRAALDNTALDLERCVIRSPMKGVVDRLFIENGQFMNAADPVAKVLDIDRVKVEVGIPESDVDAVRGVRHFRVTIDALNGRIFSGAHHYLAKTADDLARLYRLEIAVDNPKGLILPDMFTRVEIVKKEITDGLSVPLYAMVPRKEKQSVFVVDENGTANARPVSVGIQDGWRVQISEGLEPGDRVVVVGQRGIDDGEAVEVIRKVDTLEELNQ